MIGLAKKFVRFGVTKRHIFHFHRECHRTMYSLTERTFWPAQYLTRDEDKSNSSCRTTLPVKKNSQSGETALTGLPGAGRCQVLYRVNFHRPEWREPPGISCPERGGHSAEGRRRPTPRWGGQAPSHRPSGASPGAPGRPGRGGCRAPGPAPSSRSGGGDCVVTDSG